MSRTSSPRVSGRNKVTSVQNPFVPQVFARTGHSTHFRVLTPTGEEGLRIVNSDARIDLLITDIGLPGGMSGREVASNARIIRPGLKVLFITGYAENAVLNHGHLEPGMQMMTKPFAVEALASRIRELIPA